MLSRSPDGVRLNDDSQRVFVMMYEGLDEVSAGEGHQEHDDHKHGEEP